jgi:hypothetical protein
MVTKAKVEIEEKEKSPQEQALELVLKRIEKPVQPPPIEETVQRVATALAQAKKATTKIRKTWYCTECGKAHIQLYLDGEYSGHFRVDLLDNEPVYHGTEEPINKTDKRNMDLARAKSGK